LLLLAFNTLVTLTHTPGLVSFRLKPLFLLELSNAGKLEQAGLLGGNMKKISMLLVMVASAWAQSASPAPAADPADQNAPQNTSPTSVSFPVVRIETPTNADLYCAGFITKQAVPNANFIAGGLQTPNTTKFVNNDIVYMEGSGYQVGARYTIVRELQDPNKREMFAGQHAALAGAGQPYAEVGRVRVIDTRNRTAVAQVEFACDTITVGDTAIPFAEKPAISFHAPLRFDRFAPPSGKLTGRIVLAKDFDSVLGTGMKVYMNVGASQGVKVGDYFRAVRSYTADLNDPVDSLSFRASTTEDTQKRPPRIEPTLMDMNYGKGPLIRVRDLPQRAVGEIVVLGVTPTTATGMIVFALEDVHVGDGVELDQQQQ
jgi:hypothetical protein